MKHVFLSLAFAFSLISLHAGSFGGPPPFQNGSPLQSGTDGSYQAVARGTNLTGIFSFQIQNGAQTSGQQGNTWVFFVDGQVLNGTTSANVSEGKVAGILDSGLSGGIPTNPNGTVILPIAFVIPGNAGSGSFNGNIDLSSPVAAFNGNGLLTGTPARTDQIIFISDPALTFGVPPVTSTLITIPGSTLADNNFNFRGTRLSTTPIVAATPTPTP